MEPSAPTVAALRRAVQGFGEMVGVCRHLEVPTRCVWLIFTFSLSVLDITLAVLCRELASSFLPGRRGLISYFSPWPYWWWLGGTGIPAAPRQPCPPGMWHLWEWRAADNEQAIKRLSKKRHRVKAVCCSSSIFINSYIQSSELGSRMKVITILRHLNG